MSFRGSLLALSTLSIILGLLVIQFIKQMLRRLATPVRNLSIIFILNAILFVITALYLIIVPKTRQNPRMKSIIDRLIKLLAAAVIGFVLFWGSTLIVMAWFPQIKIGLLPIPSPPSPPASAFWEWVNSIPPEVEIYSTIYIPTFYSTVVFFNMIKQKQRAIGLKRWSELEAGIEKNSPGTTLVALLAHVVGFLAGLRFLPLSTRWLLLLTLLCGISRITLSSANWYLTRMIFERREFNVNGRKISLIARHKCRIVSWSLTNLAFVPLLWVVWGIIAIALVSFLYL